MEIPEEKKKKTIGVILCKQRKSYQSILMFYWSQGVNQVTRIKSNLHYNKICQSECINSQSH